MVFAMRDLFGKLSLSSFQQALSLALILSILGAGSVNVDPNQIEQSL